MKNCKSIYKVIFIQLTFNLTSYSLSVKESVSYCLFSIMILVF